MPQTINLTRSLSGGAPAGTQSVRAWLYASPFGGYPAPPAPMPATPAEVPLANAHYVVFEAFSGRNATGTSFGRGSVESDIPLVDRYGADPESILVAAFGD